VNLVGAGAMGSVYRAFDELLNRRVALKTMKSRVSVALSNEPTGVGNSAAAAEEHGRWLREAQSLARVSHPNIVSVYDVGVAPGIGFFLAMEYIEGGTLRTWLANERRNWQEITRVLIGAGEGLAAAHRVGVVHRDFKPDNILVTAENVAKVADFGLAKVQNGRAYSLSTRVTSMSISGGQSEFTRAGDIVGTPAYMAPEQIQGEEVDERADIFAFCVTFYQALLGNRPFDGDDLHELLASIHRQEFCSPKADHKAPKGLIAAITRGLAYERSERYATMQEALEAISVHLEGAKFGARAAMSMVAISVLGLGLAIPALAGGESVDFDRRCGVDQQVSAADWSSGRRVEIARQFAATDAAYGQEIFSRLDTKMNHYVENWEHVHQQACSQATQEAEAKRSGAALLADADRQLKCLDRARSALEAFSEGLRRVNEKVVQKAMATAQALPDPVACLSEANAIERSERNIGGGRGRMKTRPRSELGEQELIGAHMKRKMGAPDEAQPVLEKLLNASRAADDIALFSKAALEQSLTLLDRRDFTRAKQLAWASLVSAGATDDREIQLSAAMELFLSTTDELHEEVRANLDALMRRSGESGRLAAKWNYVQATYDLPLGSEHWRHPHEARRWLDFAIEGFVASHGYVSVEVQHALEMRAALESADFYDWNAALWYLAQAMAIQEKIGGPNHPDRVRLWIRDSEIRASGGDLETAFESATQARDLSVKLAGPMSMANAEAYSRHATLLRVLGRYSESAAEVSLLESIYAKAWGRADWRTTYFRGRTLVGLVRYAGRFRLATEYLNEWIGPKLEKTQSVLQGIDLAGEGALEAIRLGEFELAQRYLTTSAAHWDAIPETNLRTKWLSQWSEALLALEQGNVSRARELLERAAQAEKDESAISEGSVLIHELWLDLGQLYLLVGERENSERALNMARSLVAREAGDNSHLMATVEDLAVELAWKFGDLKRARELAIRALALHDPKEASPESGAWRRFAVVRVESALKSGDRGEHRRIASEAALVFRRSEWRLALRRAEVIEGWLAANERK
jgi:tetratricopeptide (TPR) repeat protein